MSWLSQAVLTEASDGWLFQIWSSRLRAGRKNLPSPALPGRSQSEVEEALLTREEAAALVSCPTRWSLYWYLGFSTQITERQGTAMYFSSACILCRVDKLQGSTTVQLCNCTTGKLQDSTQPTGRHGRELLLNEDLPPTYSWLLTPQNHTELHLEITRNYSWKAHRITPRNHSQLHLEITRNYTWKSHRITPGNHSNLHLKTILELHWYTTQNHTWTQGTTSNYSRILLITSCLWNA